MWTRHTMVCWNFYWTWNWCCFKGCHPLMWLCKMLFCCCSKIFVQKYWVWKCLKAIKHGGLNVITRKERQRKESNRNPVVYHSLPKVGIIWNIVTCILYIHNKLIYYINISIYIYIYTLPNLWWHIFLSSFLKLHFVILWPIGKTWIPSHQIAWKPRSMIDLMDRKTYHFGDV